MPRKFPVDLEELSEILRAERDNLFDYKKNGFKGPSDVVWQSISKKLEHKIRPKHIYTILKQNRKNILAKIDFKIESNEPFIPKDDLSSSDDTKNEQSISFLIELSAQQWQELSYSTHYKRKERPNSFRVYSTLKPHQWTDIIHIKFFEKTRLSCPVVYKRCNIHEEGAVYLTLSGKCSICQSKLQGTMQEKPIIDKNIQILCTYEGDFEHCSSIENQKKRRITGDRKATYIHKMINEKQSASMIRRLEAQERMEYGDVEPSNLPTSGALRKMKCSEIKKYKLHNDAIIALSILKETMPYKDVIHDIGYDRFFIYYWSSTEINNYRLYARKENFPRISIDATGKLVKKFKIQSGRETSAIFLYQIVVRDALIQSQFAVGHMLSERHDNNSIAHWLGEWLRNDIPAPKIVVLDQSLALMMAVVRIFTQYSTLAKYLNTCSALLNNETNIEIPSCMIRNDFAHIMHLVSGWSEIKTAPKRVKNFYLRAIAIIISCTSFTEVKRLLQAIFTVAMNEEEGNTPKGTPTSCELAKYYLKILIACPERETKFNDYVNETDLNLKDLMDAIGEDEIEINEDLSKTSYFDQIKNIYDNCYNDAQSSTQGDRDNLHFSPTLAKKMLNFCHLLPIWGAVMNNIFHYGEVTESSCTSESMFNDLKNRVFGNENLPIRVDEFIPKHIDSIIGSMILVRSKHRQNELGNDKNESPIVQSCLKNSILPLDVRPVNLPLKTASSLEEEIIKNESQENWRGLACCSKNERRRKTYLDSDATILKCNDESKTKNIVIGILKNASSLNLKAVHIGNKYYSLSNTCSFDAVIQILFAAYAESEKYAEFVDKNKEQLIFELIRNGVRDGITVQTYRKRAEILKNYFEGNPFAENMDHIHVNVAGVVYHLIKQLFQEFPSTNEIERCHCCNDSKSFAKGVISVHLPNDNMDYFHDALNNELNRNKKCHTCGGAAEINYNFGSHIFLELIRGCSSQFNTDINTKLSAIPHNILNHQLRGAISFLAPQAKAVNAIGHYIAYCWRASNQVWEKVDDFSDSIKIVRSNTEAVNCQILVYTI